MPLAEKEMDYQLQPVFISIDPERDSVPQVKEYVKEFHPRMIGLTGPVEKVKPESHSLSSKGFRTMTCCLSRNASQDTKLHCGLLLV